MCLGLVYSNEQVSKLIPHFTLASYLTLPYITPYYTILHYTLEYTDGGGGEEGCILVPVPGEPLAQGRHFRYVHIIHYTSTYYTSAYHTSVYNTLYAIPAYYVHYIVHCIL